MSFASLCVFTYAYPVSFLLMCHCKVPRRTAKKFLRFPGLKLKRPAISRKKNFFLRTQKEVLEIALFLGSTVRFYWVWINESNCKHFQILTIKPLLDTAVIAARLKSSGRMQQQHFVLKAHKTINKLVKVQPIELTIPTIIMQSFIAICITFRCFAFFLSIHGEETDSTCAFLIIFPKIFFYITAQLWLSLWPLLH